MNFSRLVTINGLVFIIFGIAFALYAPLMMAVFSVPEVVEIDFLEYWQIAAFARLLGAALFGYGLLLWSLRGFAKQAPPQVTRGIASAMVLANALAAFVSLTQQSAIWKGPAGWFATGIFVIFILAYTYILVVSTKPPQETSPPAD